MKGHPHLKVLILEDLPTDAELIQLYLQELDYNFDFKVTDKAHEYHELIESFEPDLVFSDFNLPGYDGLKALRHLRKKNPYTPFLFVTGALGEENAVSAIKNGASDFLIKEHIHHLPKATMKALREYQEIKRKEAYERQLVAINTLNASLIQHSDWKQALNKAFPDIGQTLQVDRAYFFKNDVDKDTGQEVTTQLVEWSSELVEPQINNPALQKLPLNDISELVKPLKEAQPFQAITQQLSDSPFKEILVDQCVLSILVLPLYINGNFFGFVGFDDCTREREWSPDEFEFLESLTSSLGGAIYKAELLEDLRKSERNLRKAQQIAGLGYWSHNLEKDVSEWGEECFRIYGFDPENFRPTLENVIQTFHPEDRQMVESDLREITTVNEEQQLETRIITSTGEVRWVDMRINLVADEKGIPYKIEGTVQDITDRKTKEEELRISQERFELAMKATNEMIWDWDHNTNQVLRSFGYKSSFGYNTQEPAAINNSWFSRVHPEDRSELWIFIESFLKDPSTTNWEREYRLIKPDGTMAFVADHGYVIRDKEGRPLRSVGAVVDVTQSRQQFEKIKHQNQTLREIAWVQSHVVRAPLSRIMALTHLIQDKYDTGKSVDELMEMISTAAAELDDVIRNITSKTEE